MRARGARGRGHRNRCHAGALGSRSWVVIGEVGHRTCIGGLLGNLGWSVVWIGGGKDGVEPRGTTPFPKPQVSTSARLRPLDLSWNELVVASIMTIMPR